MSKAFKCNRCQETFEGKAPMVIQTLDDKGVWYSRDVHLCADCARVIQEQLHG